MTNNLIVINEIVSEPYFNLMKEFADRYVEFIARLKNDRNFKNELSLHPEIPLHEYESFDEFIDFFMSMDLLKCFSLTSNISNLKSKESFAYVYVSTKSLGLGYQTYDSLNTLYNNGTLSILEKRNKVLEKQLKWYNNDDLTYQIAQLLSAYDNKLKNEYLSSLYRFVSIVIKADGFVTKEEEEILKRIMRISGNNAITKSDSSSEKEKLLNTNSEQKLQTIDEVLEELNSLVGLDGVKQEMKTLINYLKVQQAREASGLKSSNISYHIVFTGNPGTGKTTVARILAKIYKALKVLSQGHLIETDRSGLIGEYIGQTAIKVNKTIDSAINGVLFIDEAYSIAGETLNDFGKEAVATLIKRMEDDRDKLIVVIAGYTNEMYKFIETNPGFKSRFNRYIDFDDYSPKELQLIFQNLCLKLDYKLTDEAYQKLQLLFEDAYANRDKTFGNGRFVRNIFEKSLERQANRIASVALLNKEILSTIIADDVP